MRKQLFLAAALLAFAAPAFATAPLTACDVLTKTDLAAAQGQEFSEAKLSAKTQGSLSVSQCFYRLPSFEKSVSVTLVRPSTTTDRSSILDYWKAHDATSVMDKNDDGDGDRPTAKNDRDDDDHHGNATRVSGLGDDAVWSGTPMASALHVLRHGTIVRISVGGSAPLDQKLKVSRRLAMAILKRLSVHAHVKGTPADASTGSQ
ncbi:MAG TPA: hypothetical protein VLC46_14200 [Thermoanaerobaculia bacterium]|jgi:hypothetical protein|nr:hypothetical protein [Thermoanaerobaculia bacterium]